MKNTNNTNNRKKTEPLFLEFGQWDGVSHWGSWTQQFYSPGYCPVLALPVRKN